ncbi:MAG: hypothetical protein NTU73_04520 [Ignavibacteriae bacterium]|nr:hypothetical protein [Ignavibacteriota bacterium]
MAKFILLFFFLPLFGYSQNMLTVMWISKVDEATLCSDVSEYELYTIKISPGYRDHTYKFKLIQIDSKDKETILSEPEIGVKLNIYKKDYEMYGGKIEWDYTTEVKSNDIWTDEYIEIGDCSNSKHLTCLLRVKKTEKYKVKINYGNKEDTEFLIGG